jgi:hypothetical protein
MMPEILAGIRNLLNNDSTLQGYIGVNRVLLGWLTERATFPCVTVIESSEGSRPRVGYADGRRRDMSPTVQIDIWVDKTGDEFPCTVEDVETIVARIDELLFGTGVTNTRGWSRVSSSGPIPDGNLYHKTLRYGFAYSVQD